MCELLSYFCDCELQHRVEAIVAFGDIYVSKLQANQKFRYNELMQALNMSAALTARKTKEFRSPPQEQVRTPFWASIPFLGKTLNPVGTVLLKPLCAWQPHELWVIKRPAQHQETGLVWQLRPASYLLGGKIILPKLHKGQSFLPSLACVLITKSKTRSLSVSICTPARTHHLKISVQSCWKSVSQRSIKYGQRLPAYQSCTILTGIAYDPGSHPFFSILPPSLLFCILGASHSFSLLNTLLNNHVIRNL